MVSTAPAPISSPAVAKITGQAVRSDSNREDTQS